MSEKSVVEKNQDVKNQESRQEPVKQHFGGVY